MRTTCDRDDLRGWIGDHWDAAKTVREWWADLFDAGLAQPTWARGVGGLGADEDAARLITEELGAAGVLAPPSGVGQAMGGPTIAIHGTPAQRRVLNIPLAKGETSWVQLFSEPGAGSDLASLATRAEPTGDEWTVTGQKVWSSGADTATHGMLLARTALDRPKHKGITFFLIDLRQPGVEIRPLRQMNGDAYFCEVFLDGACVPHDRIIGEVNDGWRVTRTTLTVERGGVPGAAARAAGMHVVEPGPIAGNLDLTVEEAMTRPAAGRRAADGFFLSGPEMVHLAQQAGRWDEPALRQEIMRYFSHTEVTRLLHLRVKEAMDHGRAPGPEASTLKLALGSNARRFRDLALEVTGAQGMLAGPPAGAAESVIDTFLWSFACNIGGGTDEIQRNVIGEGTLGLPREPQPDRDIAYRDLQVATTQRSERERCTA